MQTLSCELVRAWSDPVAHEAPFEARLFRRVLGQFPTGVTVVTTWDALGRPVGATVSSFNSVSLDPPLVLFSLAHASACCADFAGEKALAIHVLAAHQAALSTRFARGGADKWEGLDFATGEYGAPVLPEALVTYECEPFAQYPGGDHTIFVARVHALHYRRGEPLVFCDGGYRTLQAREAA